MLMDSLNQFLHPAGVYNPDGSALYLNETFVTITGYSREELMGAGS